ncbi:MAG: hypothetical protein LC633_03665 [Desulfobulbaceae bacterium]|nr:hypothetical protein [Desulfobulbaceae bacterium]
MQKITRASVLLLALFLGTSLIIPPGMDLELCFGEDGHVDFSLGSCTGAGSAIAAARELTAVYATAPNTNCGHFTVACGTGEEPLLSGRQPAVHKQAPANTPFITPPALSGLAGSLSNRKAPPIPVENPPPSQLVSLGTVVLLI